MDPEASERVDEGLRVMPRVRRVAVVDLVGDVGERPPHLMIDSVGRQERLGVHGVEVVDAVEQRRPDPVRAQRARDRVEDDRAAQAADVDGPRRRLRVVDDLRARVTDPLCQLVRPVHRRRRDYEMLVIL
jgi:hypothetical protein